MDNKPACLDNKNMAQWKSTVDVFLFHSILYLCIMNMLEQLARIVLPKEILDNFDIVKIETDESDIDSEIQKNADCFTRIRISGNLVGISINLCKSIQKELFINDTP